MESEGNGAAVEEARANTIGNRLKEELPRRVEGASEERQTVEKPHASEEIVVEGISIDGMCGVY